MQVRWGAEVFVTVAQIDFERILEIVPPSRAKRAGSSTRLVFAKPR